MSYFFEILMLGLASFSLYWEGALSTTYDYTLNAPRAVSVEEGQSVVIPCNFTYPALAKNNMVKLYGYWYDEGSNIACDPPVATNDDRKTIAQYARKRFYLLEGLKQGVCSFVIINVQYVDQKTYFFRMEKGKTRINYHDFQTTVTVTASHKDFLSTTFGSLKATVSFLIGLLLIKVFLCFLLFFVIFWFSSWRKTQLKSSRCEQITRVRPTESITSLLPNLFDPMNSC